MEGYEYSLQPMWDETEEQWVSPLCRMPEPEEDIREDSEECLDLIL
jgi:hypothetical protein